MEEQQYIPEDFTDFQSEVIYNPAWFQQDNSSPYESIVDNALQQQQSQQANEQLHEQGVDTQSSMISMFEEMQGMMAEMSAMKERYAQSSEAAQVEADDDLSDMDDFRAIFGEDDVNTPVDWKARTQYKQNEAAQKSYTFFIQKGLTPAQSAGLVGNFAVETGDFDANVIYGKRKGDSGKATGLAQWHPDRFNPVKKYAISKGLDPYSLEGQLEGAWWELNNSESGALNKIKQARTPQEAAILTDKYYERSAGIHRTQRQQKAANIYNAFN